MINFTVRIALFLLLVIIAWQILVYTRGNADSVFIEPVIVTEPVSKNSECYHVDCYDSSGANIGGKLGAWVTSMGAR